MRDNLTKATDNLLQSVKECGKIIFVCTTFFSYPYFCPQFLYKVALFVRSIFGNTLKIGLADCVEALLNLAHVKGLFRNTQSCMSRNSPHQLSDELSWVDRNSLCSNILRPVSNFCRPWRQDMGPHHWLKGDLDLPQVLIQFIMPYQLFILSM